MKKLKILYILLIAFTCTHSVKCQKLNYNQNLTRSFQDETILITAKQADSCLKVNQAYQTTKGLLKVEQKEKEVYKNQAKFFFVKADSLSLANETLSIQLKKEKKEKRNTKIQLWGERLLFIASFFVFK